MRAVLALEARDASAFGSELSRLGCEIVAVVPPETPVAHLGPMLAGADVLVLGASRTTLHRGLIELADRFGVRVVPVSQDEGVSRIAAIFGLPEPLDRADPARAARRVLAAPRPAHRTALEPGRVVTVWGPHGAPGRTRIAIEAAVSAARGGRHVALVDADSHAPSIALALGLPDEGPGFAAACRQAERGELDVAELARISLPLGTPGADVDVLVGINRPSRWPELSAARVGAALAACRTWAGVTVVDVAASVESDEEIVSDVMDGPRRNAATRAALLAADRVVAVAAADPVGIARFIRDHAAVRALIGATPVTVLVNRARAGALGPGGQGQIRRTLERYADVADVRFLPEDRRAVDGAVLAARPLGEVAPRSPLTAALTRMTAERPGASGLTERRMRVAAPSRKRRTGPVRARTGDLG